MPSDQKSIKFSNKVLIFATEYFPKATGAGLALKGITDNIDIVKFDMITTRLNRELPRFDKIGKINVYRIGIGLPFIDRYILAFFGSWFAQGFFQEKKYSAIWGIGSDHAGLASMFFKKNNPRVPFFLTLQDEDNPRYLRKKLGFVDPWFRRIFTLADYIQCVNSELVEWAKRMGAINPVVMIPNGIKFEDFHKGGIRKFYIDNLREKLNIKESEKVVLAGPCENKKIAKSFIKAIELLKSVNKFSLKILIYEVKNSRFLKRQVKKAGLEKDVIFIDKIEGKEMANYFWVSEVFFCMTDAISAITFLEAMAAQAPVVSPNSKKIPAFFLDRENGFIYNPNDYLDIADKIEHLVKEDSNIRAKIVQNGERLALEQYSYERIKILIENIYDKLFGAKTKS